jgi:hypothetical protein
MRFVCRVAAVGGGWRAEVSDDRIGEVAVTASQREEALEKLQREIRYRLELCPCSGVGERYVELEVQKS